MMTTVKTKLDEYLIQRLLVDRLRSGFGRRTFELLFGIQVDLLGLSDLFEDILNDHSIVYPNITIPQQSSITISNSFVSSGTALSDRKQVKDVPRSQFDMVVALYDVDVEFPLGRGDEDSLIDFELRMDVRKATCWISKKSRM